MMKSSNPKKAITFLFWIALGVALCFALGNLLNLDVSEFLLALRRFSISSLVLGLGIVLIQIGFQISRLWVLFPRNIHMSWFYAARTFTSGQFVSNFIQGQAGHAVKIAVASKYEHRQGRSLPLAEAAAIVLVDKFLDVFTLIALTALAAVQLSGKGLTHFFETLNLSLVAGIGLTGLAAALVIGGICKFSTRIQRAFGEFRQGLNVIRDPGQLGRGVAMGLEDWFTEGCLLQTLCVAQGYPLSPAQLMVCLFLLNVGISAPISIANLGTFEAALTFGLIQMGVPLAPSIAIATLFHLFQMLGILLWMLANTWHRDRSFKAPDQKDTYTPHRDTEAAIK